ncbi:hypothetical protein [Segatella maculosa]|uniref:Lipocalin-like domain-containing protein n=1 Tax=Segatella maculosa OT 289 TaxID=999422 RepID=H1HNM1_9BACT|nr:hypothetical protein [Segatella maculosa]EHO68900.1 hypothetical protein HMPREF9944_01765 [Segatella maculosa OT 289]
MKTTSFLASAAKAAFALAAVVMMSAAFTACSSSDDDNGGGTPPPPAPKAGFVTLDGTEKPIVKAEYEDGGNGNYYLYLLTDSKEIVRIDFNKGLHMTGSPISLTKKEEKHAGFYWLVKYYKSDSSNLIGAYGEPGSSEPSFKTGTLTISGSPESTINIKLENGRVMGEDGKEHTLTISYSGTMTKK